MINLFTGEVVERKASRTDQRKALVKALEAASDFLWLAKQEMVPLLNADPANSGPEQALYNSASAAHSVLWQALTMYDLGVGTYAE